jgi:SPP1 family holin
MKVDVKHEIKPDTIIRTICLALALLNQLLTAAGKSAIPIKDEQVAELVSAAITIGAAVWAWWKNNSFSQAALAGDTLMRSIKNREKLEDTK